MESEKITAERNREEPLTESAKTEDVDEMWMSPMEQSKIANEDGAGQGTAVEPYMGARNVPHRARILHESHRANRGI